MVKQPMRSQCLPFFSREVLYSRSVSQRQWPTDDYAVRKIHACPVLPLSKKIWPCCSAFLEKTT